MKWLKAILLIIASIIQACIYGILHDLITAHVCIEYFSVAHPVIILALHQDPVAHAFIWGILATWWVGLLGGLLLAAILTFRHRGQYRLRSILTRTAKILAQTGVCAGLAGILGFGLGKWGVLQIPNIYYGLIPDNRTPDFFFDAFAHTTSYLVGAILILRLAHQLWKEAASAGTSYS